VARVKIYPSRAVPTKTDSNIAKISRKTIWFGMEPGKTMNIERVEDSLKFLDWVRTFKLDIGIKSYSLWK